MLPSTPPPPTVLDPRPSSSGGSTWKGALVGAAVGLAFVGAVVVGSRLAVRHNGAVNAAAAAGGPQAAVPALEAPVTPQLPAPAAPAAQPQGATGSLVPVVSASDLPHARAVGRGRKAKGAAAAPAADTAAAAEAATAPPATATAAASAAPPADTAAAAPEDSAASLVPVIPAAAPPPADPFVKAVQDDIQDEQQAHSK